jgi:class 3 adenylate cyclase
MSPPETLAGLAAAGDAIDRNAWKEAFALLRDADRELQLPPDWLERLAETAWWNGRLDDCIDARERAFAAYVARGEPRGAAIEALRISHNYESKLNNALESAWFKRAESLLDREPECVEHAHLARARAAKAALRGDLDEALALAEQALDLGTRYADRDLMALALHDLGRFRITKGEVQRGLGEIDEATLAAMHGEIGPYATAVIYCNVIEACRNLADYRRAGEWTEAAQRWCERQAIAGFPGQCRVDRAEVLKLRGAWAEAEQEARDACDELKHFRLPVAARAFYELGEIRLRVGDLGGATAAFAQASELGLDPQPGAALLKLATGNTAGALAAIGRALDDQPWDRLACARLLPAQVEIAVAADELGVAEGAVEELGQIAESYGSDAIRANTASARAAVQLASADPAGAVASARDAWRLWQDLDAPYEAARTRALLGAALRELGDEDAAGIQLRAARAALEELGAAPEARRVASLLSHEPELLARTFVFTDIVESTRLVEAIGDPAWESLVRWHDQTLRSLFAEHGGEEVDHAGDGFFVAFATPRTALACAIAVQRKLAAHRRDHGFAPQVRIGVHATDAAGSGGSYRGKGVHEAARIAALAGGAEIVASAATVAGDVAVTAHRSVELKGISRPVEVVTIEWQ